VQRWVSDNSEGPTEIRSRVTSDFDDLSVRTAFKRTDSQPDIHTPFPTLSGRVHEYLPSITNFVVIIFGE